MTPDAATILPDGALVDSATSDAGRLERRIYLQEGVAPTAAAMDVACNQGFAPFIVRNTKVPSQQAGKFTPDDKAIVRFADRAQVASTVGALETGGPSREILTPSGTGPVGGATHVWTGFRAPGLAGFTCENWGDTSDRKGAGAGVYNSTVASERVFSTIKSCEAANTLMVYCLEM